MGFLIPFVTGALNRAGEIRDERKAERQALITARLKMLEKDNEQRLVKAEEYTKARQQGEIIASQFGDKGIDKETAAAMIASGAYSFQDLAKTLSNPRAKITRTTDPNSTPSIMIDNTKPAVTTIDTQTQALFPGATPAGSFENFLFGERPTVGVEKAAQERAAEIGFQTGMPEAPRLDPNFKISIGEGPPAWVEDVNLVKDVDPKNRPAYLNAVNGGDYGLAASLLNDPAQKELTKALAVANVSASASKYVADKNAETRLAAQKSQEEADKAKPPSSDAALFFRIMSKVEQLKAEGKDPGKILLPEELSVLKNFSNKYNANNKGLFSFDSGYLGAPPIPTATQRKVDDIKNPAVKALVIQGLAIPKDQRQALIETIDVDALTEEEAQQVIDALGL